MSRLERGGLNSDSHKAILRPLRVRRLHPADPIAIFPNGFDGGEIAGVEDVFGGGEQFPFFEIVPGVAGANGDELEDTGVAVAVYHAAGATIANELGGVKFVDVAHRGLPEMATVEIEVPVEVKVFVATEAAEFFGFFAQMTLHLRERFAGIDDGETARAFHVFDFLEDLDEFVGFVADETRIAEAEIAGSKAGERITESAAFEAEFFEEIRQLVVVVNEFAGGDAGGGLDAELVEDLVSSFDFSADVRQSAILFVLGDVVGINGHDDAAEAVAGEVVHVLLGPKRAIRANHGMDAALGCVAGHRAHFFVD